MNSRQTTSSRRRAAGRRVLSVEVDEVAVTEHLRSLGYLDRAALALEDVDPRGFAKSVAAALARFVADRTSDTSEHRAANHDEKASE